MAEMKLLTMDERDYASARKWLLGTKGGIGVAKEIDALRARVLELERVLLSRHGGEPIALLAELDEQKARVLELERMYADMKEAADRGSSSVFALAASQERERELREALEADRDARQPMLAALAELSRTVAPILAAFRGDPKNPGPDTGGTFTEDQLDAAISAMGEVQRQESGFGARWFDQQAALSRSPGSMDALREVVTSTTREALLTFGPFTEATIGHLNLDAFVARHLGPAKPAEDK